MPYQLNDLRQRLKPFRLYWFPRVGSTNTHAARLRRQGKLFAPAVVLTGRQTTGRGRGSNQWWSGEGSITATFVLPIEEHLQPYQIPLLAGLAVRNALADLSEIPDLQLKWPNDLLFADRKLAGLLCERIDRADLIGVGLNLNVRRHEIPRALRDKVTSIYELTARATPMNDPVVAIAQNLRRMFTRRDQPSYAPLLEEYDRHHALNGRRIRVVNIPGEPPCVGRVCGLDSIGRLILRDGRQTHLIFAGSVEILNES